MIQTIKYPAVNEALADHIEELLVSLNFPWYYIPNAAWKPQPGEIVDDMLFSFSHSFHDVYKNSFTAEYAFHALNVLYEIASKRNHIIKEVSRFRAFMQTPSRNPGTMHGIHTDQNQPHLVCIYYSNDADGDTVFFDNNNKEIFRNTPKKNTAVIFDGSIPHSAETPSKRRAILNFNYLITNEVF